MVSLAAATVVPVAAQPTPDPDPGQGATELDDPGLTQDVNSIYFPWVANDDDFGLGPADTSITVQNLEAIDTYIYIYKGTGADDGWELYTTAYLAAWASKTFTANDLGIEAGTGVPVGVSSYHGGLCVTELGPAGELSAGRDINGNEQCADLEVVVTLFDELPDTEQIDVCVANTSDGLPAPYWDASVGAYVTWESVEDLEANYEAGGEYGGLNNDGDCTDAESGDTSDPLVIGGVAKQAVDGETLPYTTTEDTSVSGYNSVNGFELAQFDQWYLPIVQTNCGPGGCWDTVVRAANYADTNSAVTLRFFPSDDGSGSLNTGFQVEFLINAGATETVVLSDYVPEGWVGSVHAYSDSSMMLMADRFKVGYNMWLTNTGSSADFENVAQVEGGLGQYVLFAPDVRVDYFGWNTGINVANLAEEANNVTIQYFNMFGNATGTLTQSLAAHGMTYFYDPSVAAQDASSQDVTQDVNANVVGSALIWSDLPVAVAVDATKYPESTTELDNEVFQGTTYNATANVYPWQSVPLVQKGNPADGMGATSGINMMNPNSVAAQALVYWVNQSGFGADNFGTTGLAIPAFANGFVYTLTQHNLPNGFYGAALVTANYPIAATSANVDYQVQYDGSAMFNSFNPCGFYRTPGVFDCYLGDPFGQPGNGSVEKTFLDETGAPVEGAYAAIMNETAYQRTVVGDEEFPGIPFVAEGFSDVQGEVLFTNVPEGDYYLFADSQTDFLLNSQELPIFEPLPEEPEEQFTLMSGESLSFTNELVHLGATKIVYTGIPGVEVCLFGETDEEPTAESTFDSEADLVLDCGVADDNGDITFEGVPQGWYWVIVNGGIENPVNPEFETIVAPAEGGPEFFEWGGTYENDIAGGVVGAGTLHKTFEFPILEEGQSYTDLEMWVGIFCLEPVPNCDPEGDNEIFDGGPDSFPLDGNIVELTVDLPAGTYELCYGGTIGLDAGDDAAVVENGFFGCDEEVIIVEGETLELTNLVELIPQGGRFDALLTATEADTVYEVCAIIDVLGVEVTLECDFVVGDGADVQASFIGIDSLDYRLRAIEVGTDCVTLTEPIPYTVEEDAADGFIEDVLVGTIEGTADGTVVAPQCDTTPAPGVAAVFQLPQLTDADDDAALQQNEPSVNDETVEGVEYANLQMEAELLDAEGNLIDSFTFEDADDMPWDSTSPNLFVTVEPGDYQICYGGSVDVLDAEGVVTEYVFDGCTEIFTVAEGDVWIEYIAISFTGDEEPPAEGEEPPAEGEEPPVEETAPEL